MVDVLTGLLRRFVIGHVDLDRTDIISRPVAHPSQQANVAYTKTLVYFLHAGMVSAHYRQLAYRWYLRFRIKEYNNHGAADL
ncbi:hypothetical protein D3C87_1744880 [compost metagenome]